MAGNRPIKNDSDSMDISELAALNNDISNDLLDQLTQQLTGNIADLSDGNSSGDDASLFEEPAVKSVETNETDTGQKAENTENVSKAETPEAQPVQQKREEAKFDTSFDDNFIKKYKAKLNRKNMDKSDYADNTTKDANQNNTDTNEPIEKISKGNIAERAITQAQKEYNDSLDFLDGNVKYSKYVIYIDPQNVDFIESLTVKERKNLINKILREQDDITITKRKFNIMQAVIRHAIIAILTLSIFIPVFYFVFNASLEATIENYRRSETNWQTLYKEKGKITRN